MGKIEFDEEHPDYDVDPEYLFRIDASKGLVSFFVYDKGEVSDEPLPLSDEEESD